MKIIECHRKNEYGLASYPKLKTQQHEALETNIQKWLAKGNKIKQCQNTNKPHSFNPSNPDALHETLKKRGQNNADF